MTEEWHTKGVNGCWRAAIVNDSHLFCTSRQMNRTVKEKKKKKKESQNSPPHHYVCMCGFFSLCETKGTHQGRYITMHVSPMCYCTEIDHKSSAVKRCLIKVNLFSINADPEIKSYAHWRNGNKMSGVEM